MPGARGADGRLKNRKYLVTDLFFYGTLRHVPLLEVVLGRRATDLDVTESHLPDHAVHWVTGEPYPTIFAQTGDMAPGLLVRGLTEDDIGRLQFYEGGFDYDLKPVELARGQAAQVFFPRPDAQPVGDIWSLQDWERDWAAISVRAAAEVMTFHGQWSAQQVGERFGMIRKRASAWVSAQNRGENPDRSLDAYVAVQAIRQPYTNFFSIQELDIQVRTYDGAMGPVLERAAFFVGEAAIVLPYDPVLDVVLLTEQFRYPVFATGDRDPWVKEPVSGLVEPGETAQDAARRETVEEAGVDLSDLHPVGGAYSSTGSSTEFVYMFLGIADLSDTDGSGGVEAENEDIRTEVISYDDLMQRVDAGQFRDLPLVTISLWLARHRDRLRRAQ
jgi:nudix-type nucleoside diphosphatase (YffH/AdpP family)